MMRGSLARAICSTRPNNSTFSVLLSDEMGSKPAYKERLDATLRAGTLTRPPLAAAPMVRTVRAASIKEALEMSSE